MTFKEVPYGSDEYAKSLDLRERVLRIPIGRSLSQSDTDGEDSQLHFAMFEGDAIVACVIAKPLNPSRRVKLRQMAVCPLWQGQGIGRRLLVETEDALQSRDFRHIELHARLTAVGFYEALGYGLAGKPFIEIGIEHVKMRKGL